jgi:hypothetical protein
MASINIPTHSRAVKATPTTSCQEATRKKYLIGVWNIVKFSGEK